MHPFRLSVAALLILSLATAAQTGRAAPVGAQAGAGVQTGTAVQTEASLPANPLPAVRANQWDQANAIAARDPDPVAAKLVQFYRMLAPGAASPAEIEAFITANPDWPLGWLLANRRQLAIVGEPDPASVLAACAHRPITLPAALVRCADAEADAGHPATARADARAAWAGGLESGAPGFLARWGSILGPADARARFEHFAWAGRLADAARARATLSDADAAMADAFLALARAAPNAAATLAALPAATRHGPLLMLAHARALRQAGDEDGAVALWQSQGAAAEQAVADRQAGASQGAPASAPALFWLERSILARDLLADGRAKDAYAIAAGHGKLSGEMAADADFLTGFIALRFRHDPAAALAPFQALAARSRAAITQGRAHYWIGRAEAALGQDPRPQWRQAAAWPTTFYGQMAALALDPDPMALSRRIAALQDPAYTPAQALAFTGHEVVRAAALLTAWGDRRRAGTFLIQMGMLAPDGASRSLSAHLALGLGLPDIAVFIARHAGFEGEALPRAGWPMAADIPADSGVDPALALGLIRQESSFDAGAVSPAGARGLMQLMPATARRVAGRAVTLAALTADPGLNIALGTRYFAGLMARFGNAAPLAIAGYNAGPNRVDEWLARNGDPRIGPVDMIDWIELIPFGETRNYVQRVLENTAIYRARLGESVAPLSAAWAK